MPAEAVAVLARDLTHDHRAGRILVRALTDVGLTVRAGEVVAVVGPSGSGKSTLLHLLAGLQRPDQGDVQIAGTAWVSLRGAERARFRRRTCGIVLQGMALLPQATAAENVEVPLVLDDVAANERARRVADVLAEVGLTAEADKLPDELSGGQQQRIAIARALVARPAVLLADEPTGNLDSATGRQIAELLVQPAHERGTAVVVVTHDPAIARLADRTVELHSGRIGAPSVRGSAT